MDARERIICLMAVSFLSSNLDACCDALGLHSGIVYPGGYGVPQPTEAEVIALREKLQSDVSGDFSAKGE